MLSFPPMTGTSHPLPMPMGLEKEIWKLEVDCWASWPIDLYEELPRNEISGTECPCGEPVWIICPFLESKSARKFSFLVRTWLLETRVILRTKLTDWLPWMTEFMNGPPSFVQEGSHCRIVCRQQYLTALNYLAKGFQSQPDYSEL